MQTKLRELYAFGTLQERPRKRFIQHDMTIPDDLIADARAYPTDEHPVFIGHYWLPADTTRNPVAQNIACLDYSVAKGGDLTAYRWEGEKELSAAHFIRNRSNPD